MGTLPVGLYLLWHRRWRLALIIAFVPSIIASYVLIRYADLEAYKRSRFGRYIARSMTRAMEGVRFLGAGVMMIGAWKQQVWMFPAGLLIIFAGWFRGISLPKTHI